MHPIDFIFAIIETYMKQIPQRFMTNIDKTQGKLQAWWIKVPESPMKEKCEHPLLQTALIFCIPFVGRWIQSIGEPRKQEENLDEFEYVNDDEL